MSNYTILQRNVLGSLRHEESHKAFLRAQCLPQNDEASYFAQALAEEVDRLCEFLKPMISQAAAAYDFTNGIKVSQEIQDDLLDFILKRHWHWRMEKPAARVIEEWILHA